MREIIFYLLISFLFIQCKKENLANTSNLVKGSPVFQYHHIEQDTLNADQNLYDDQLDLFYTGWGVYEDIIFPNTTIEWSMEHDFNTQLDGQSLKCSITGGDKYNNVFFTNTTALRWEGDDWKYKKAKYLEYELDLYIEGILDCTQPDDATIEGIELTWQHIEIPYSHGFGVQFSKGGEWRYWNHQKDNNNQPIAWESFSPKINYCLTPMEWHRIKLIGYITETTIVYHSMVIDDNSFNLNNKTLPHALVEEGWVENFIQIGMQINGNKAIDLTHGHGVDPVSVYIDNVTFNGFELEEECN